MSLSLEIVSDVHYAGPTEQLRRHHEARAIRNPFLRAFVRCYRHFVWMRDPLAHNHLLDDFTGRPEEPDAVVANGDYSVDSAFVGLSDDATLESARLCLERLRQRFGSRLWVVPGDHELGKTSLFGGQGGLRWASLERMRSELGIPGFWAHSHGPWFLLSVTSSLVALPVYEPETLPSERAAWWDARERHFAEIGEALRGLRADQRVILFCHDPTALPWLAQHPVVREKLPQWECTVIGHLHSELILWQSRLLSGMPRLTFLGNSVRRMSGALSQARTWRPFRVKLCPALAGIELLKDGGFLRANLPDQASQGVRFQFVPIPRRAPSAP